jgi:TPR repeat
MNGDSSEPKAVQVVLAVDNVPLRARIRKILEGAGIVPAVLRDSREIRHLSPEQVASAFIVLDTDDDVARLVQIVNDLYKLPYLGGRGSGACILCVVGTDAIERNESLSFWEIDGGAAVFSVWTREDGEFEMIPKLIERMASQPPVEPVRLAPGFEEYVAQFRLKSNSAEPFFNLGNYLLDQRDRFRAALELATALLREAVRIDPNFAEGRARLARALLWRGESAAAVQEAREAIRLKPDLAEAHLHLGSALYNLGQKREGRKELKVAIALDKEGTVARWARNTLAMYPWEPWSRFWS